MSLLGTQTWWQAPSGRRASVSALHGDSVSWLLAEQCMRDPARPMLVIVDTPHACEDLTACLSALLPDTLPCVALPGWEILPYDSVLPHPACVSDRMRALAYLVEGQPGVVLCTVQTLLQRLPPPAYWMARTLSFEVGQQGGLQRVVDTLVRRGYVAVSQVSVPGEYAVRGGLLDCFPMGQSHPLRLDFLDDTLETIRVFDPDTQRSGSSRRRQVRVLPAQAFPMDAQALRWLRAHWLKRFDESPPRAVMAVLKAQKMVPGIMSCFPMLFESTATLFDYMPSCTQVMRCGDVSAQAAQWRQLYVDRHRNAHHVSDLPALPPDALLLSWDACEALVQAHDGLDLQCDVPSEHACSAPIAPVPEHWRAPHSVDPYDHVLHCVRTSSPGHVVFTADTVGRGESIMRTLRSKGASPVWLDDVLARPDAAMGVAVGPYTAGFEAQASRVMVLPAATWLSSAGHTLHSTTQPARQLTSRASRHRALPHLGAWRPGELVTHEDHGIGRYLGLVQLPVDGVVNEWIALEYAEGAKLYVPIDALDRVARYVGSQDTPLTRLGSDQWSRAKRRALETMRDMASELMALYAERAAQSGTAFQVDPEAYEQFRGGFPFDETPDQASAIADVLNDMQSERPMDRLICGDVGFGKTEVALRAAFVAVHNHKQVAVLVPTTLLAQQHTETFQDRFAAWPVRVAMLSRFTSSRETQTILKDIERGTLDIVIATHKLLSRRVQFHDLGLIILDEEHRFGVAQKERLKQWKHRVDVLTMTATPIPRTLSMAYAQLRDLSIIATPPARRLSVQTFVLKRSVSVIQEAVTREIMRGGQVYFVHNHVDTLAQTERDLKRWLPHVTIQSAHGQIPKKDLERIMLGFYHQQFDVLLCTTIIETGIDVPTANTLIVDKAEGLGLAQLHQLRGRVGRSHHQAYAYLFKSDTITAEAEQRLEAIATYNELGAGFALANQDLDIRGSGELLGGSQSGHMEAVGASLYLTWLDKTVALLQSGQAVTEATVTPESTHVHLYLPAHLPDTYVSDVPVRIALYRRMNQADSEEALLQLRWEVEDRFGSLPQPAVYLFNVLTIKLLMAQVGVVHLDWGPKSARVDFGPHPRVDHERFVALLQQSDTYQLVRASRLVVRRALPDPTQRLQAAEDLLRAWIPEAPRTP